MIKNHKEREPIMVQFRVKDMTNVMCLHETKVTGDNGDIAFEFNTIIDGAPFVKVSKIVKNGKSVAVGIGMYDLVETLIAAAKTMGLTALLESSEEPLEE